jgi:hypothetical protein
MAATKFDWAQAKAIQFWNYKICMANPPTTDGETEDLYG